MQSRTDTNCFIAGEPDTWVHSACILCSNGCGLDIAVKDGRIVGVRGAVNHPVNSGHLGPKGRYGWVANNSKRRGTTPMVRYRKDQPLHPVNWPEAMDFFIDRFKAAWKQGHQNLACYNSGQLTLEELYTLGKLWRGGLRSCNIDGNTRLCTATSATGLSDGRWEGVAMVVDTVLPGELFIPFHYGHGAQSANQHTWYARDPVSHQPQFKSSPAALRRLSFGQPEPWLLARLAELNGEKIEPFAARSYGTESACQ